MSPISLRFRRAVAADAPAVTALSQAAYQKFVERVGRLPQPLTADYAEVIRTDDTWVAEDNGSLVGVLVLKPARDHLLIWSVAVAPELQRSGIGRRLLALAEREALRRGVSEIRLYTNEKMAENIALYEYHGYAVVRREALEDRVLVHMSKKIPGGVPGFIGVLLAGGRSQRMGGGDKCLRPLGGKPILAHVIERACPQVRGLILNANGDPARFASFGLPVVPDTIPDFAGPLAGVLAGLDWAAANAPDCPWVVTIPADSPLLPRDLVARLIAERDIEQADIVCAMSAGQRYPVVGLWPVRLREDLRRAITQEDMHKVDAWSARYRLAVAEFAVDRVDPFFNANSPEDLVKAEQLLAQI
ncbi:MAG TPA: molybdenum cofactor guanylyltransferase MobA [Dongiaceae bacterium]